MTDPYDGSSGEYPPVKAGDLTKERPTLVRLDQPIAHGFAFGFGFVLVVLIVAFIVGMIRALVPIPPL
jgi:hypothetical protein